MSPIFKKKHKLEATVPAHVAIVMDGNGRWAQRRGLPRTAGHTAGAANFKKITMYAADIGIKYLTLYTFSTENWKRSDAEVGALMRLFKQYLEEALRDFLEENIKVNFLGDTEAFDTDLKNLIEDVKNVSANRTGMVLNLAMNYGGRAEIIHAVSEIMNEGIEGVTEDTIAAHLYTAGMPDPDLVIRPSGEMRTSNFLLWQTAYSEFIFSDILWPDFKPKDLDNAIIEFNRRNRRFGGV